MGVAFKLIRTGDAELDRVQQNVQAAFQQLGAAGVGAPVTTKGPQYRMSGAETALFVDARGGPVLVVLPESPAGIVTLRSVASTPNKVTITSVAPTIDGASRALLDSLATLRFGFDGTAWWSL